MGEWLRLGYAIAGHPDIEDSDIEDWLRRGELSYAQAFILGDLYRAEANPELRPVFDPDDLKDEDVWLHCMLEQPVHAGTASGRTKRIGEFRTQVREHTGPRAHWSASTLVREHTASLREEGAKTRTWSTPLTDNTQDKLDRTREVANQKADKKLTNDQLLNLLLTSYLLDNEPRWADSRERRMPPPSSTAI